jgi:O-succinylbenzoic acid--CoA ligase
MDATLLTTAAFWNDPAPLAPAGFPGGLPADDRLSGSVLFGTSGSSGQPKWVVISKAALLVSAAAVNHHLRVSAQSCWGLALPLHHVGGFGVAARAFEAGCRLEVFGKRWDARAFCDWLGHSGATHGSLVPTQVHDLVRSGLRAPASLLAIVVGGGHLDVATGRAARALGWPVLASYGMTEASSQIATQGIEALADLYQPSPIPLLPIWQAEVPADGLLRIAGPALFAGYITMDAGDRRFSPRAGDWYSTSDRVSLDINGITPSGRADLWVKVLGELVDPEAIERELLAWSQGGLTPGTFAVIAVPDERAGHVLVPVFESSVDRSRVDAALASYDAQCPGFRRLRPPAFVDHIPRSALGKLLRAGLSKVYGDSDFS